MLTHYDQWHGNGSEASAALRVGGLVVPGGMKLIREAVGQTSRFHRVPIITASGWSSHGFAMPDGRLIVPTGEAQPLRIFETTPGMMASGGTLAGWITTVAQPLARHSLASFLLMTVFAAPLLRLTDRADNFGFELCGAGGRGKSTIQLLVASAAGPATGGDGGRYWCPLNTTTNALETLLPRYNDLLLIIDEAGLMPGAGRTNERMQAMRDLALRMSAGGLRDRMGQARVASSRFIYLISTNVPITAIGSGLGAESEPIFDRLLTLRMEEDRPFGIFDFSPTGFDTTGEFADALKRGAAEHYGRALPAFLQYLVDRNRQPDILRRIVKRYVDLFTARSGADLNDGSQKRVAEAFGLVYAAGRLAKNAGVLPGSYKPGVSALTAYRLHRDHSRPATSFDERLQEIMARASTIDLERTPIASLTNDQINSCATFIYTGRAGRRELLIRPNMKKRIFPNWSALCRTPDCERRLLRSDQRQTARRRLGLSHRDDAWFCFDVTDLLT